MSAQAHGMAVLSRECPHRRCSDQAKLANTDFGAFMVMVCGFVVPLRSPVKPVKAYPAFGVAATDAVATDEPNSGP